MISTPSSTPKPPNAPAPSSRTKLLDAALQVIRTKGYTATTVDEICQAAGVTKGSFFHHFKGKEELAIQATLHWSDVTGAVFAGADYHRLPDPRDRVLGYLDLRADMLAGEVPDFTCLLGTMVQETFTTHPAIRDACQAGIAGHAHTVAVDIAEAQALYAPDAAWDAEELALYTQAALQGAFVLAKAQGGAHIAAVCVAHLRAYVQALLTPGAAVQPALPGHAISDLASVPAHPSNPLGDTP